MAVYGNLPPGYTQTIYEPNLYGPGYGTANPLAPLAQYLGGDIGSLQRTIRDYLNPDSAMYNRQPSRDFMSAPPQWLLDLLKPQPVMGPTPNLDDYLTSTRGINTAPTRPGPTRSLPTTYADVLAATGGYGKQVEGPTQQLFDTYMKMVGPALAAQANVRNASAGAAAPNSPTFDQMTYAAELPVRSGLAQAASQPALSGLMGLMGLNRQLIANDDSYQRQNAMNQDSFNRQRFMSAEQFDRQRYMNDLNYQRQADQFYRQAAAQAALQYALAGQNAALQWDMFNQQSRLAGIGGLAGGFMQQSMMPGRQFQTAPHGGGTAFAGMMGGEYKGAGGGGGGNDVPNTPVDPNTGKPLPGGGGGTAGGSGSGGAAFGPGGFPQAMWTGWNSTPYVNPNTGQGGTMNPYSSDPWAWPTNTPGVFD